MTTVTSPRRLAPGRWTADPERTRTSFAVGNLGVRVVHGSIRVVSGELQVDADGRPVRVSAELEVGTVDTGNAKRDADLRKPGLLDAGAHPVMTFASHDIGPDGTGWRADGVLALRGTTCPLTVTGSWAGGSTPGTVAVTGTATLDRTAVGIRAPRFLIGRTVTITVEAELSRAAG
jgi:polyisoprenoid-binding protein YceI